MIGHRMSVLPLTRYCSAAGPLCAQYGAGLEALISQVYHAKCAQTDGWRDLADRLPEDTRAAVLSWPNPPVTEVADSDGVLHSLDYGNATVEHTVFLDRFGFSCGPDDALTQGHLDMRWAPEGSQTVFVADIKWSIWTVPDFEESLQLHAYGLSSATELGRPFYRIGIWTPNEELWHWDDHCIKVDSLEGSRRQRAVVAAARNRDEQATTGPHCARCWGRTHCKEFLLPAALGCTKLQAICEGQNREPTNEEVLAAFTELSALDALLAIAKPALHALSDRSAIHNPASNMYYYGRMRAGRESVSVKSLRQGLGEQAEPYITRGKPYPVHDWYKNPPGARP